MDGARSLEQARSAARVEAPADRARVAGLVLDDPRSERLEPVEAVVQPLDDQPLQRGVAAGHSARKSSSVRWRQMTPLERSIEPPGAVALLENERLRPELARPRGRDEAGHARTGDR